VTFQGRAWCPYLSLRRLLPLTPCAALLLLLKNADAVTALAEAGACNRTGQSTNPE